MEPSDWLTLVSQVIHQSIYLEEIVKHVLYTMYTTHECMQQQRLEGKSSFTCKFMWLPLSTLNCTMPADITMQFLGNWCHTPLVHEINRYSKTSCRYPFFLGNRLSWKSMSVSKIMPGNKIINVMHVAEESFRYHIDARLECSWLAVDLHVQCSTLRE